MLTTFLYTFLGFFGLGLLIFIHELGHYLAAKWVGMRVEVFSIGFMKPIWTWQHQGTRWQVCWLLFGGYVKIAGTETAEEVDPYKIPDGFFGKKPLARIIVALAGPVANLLFALIAYTALWGMGGLTKNFSEYSHKIGWVDTQSELYKKGLRPGDEVTAYNGRLFQSAKDHLEVPMTSGDQLTVSGYKIDYATKERTPFEYTVSTYPHPTFGVRGIKTVGVLGSANYILYDRLNQEENPLPANSPLANSHIEYGDRIVWVNGELIFSAQQLNKSLNDNHILVTIQRNNQTLLRRVPRVLAQELKFDQTARNEITDWQYEAGMSDTKWSQLYLLPYNLTNEAVVENSFKLMDPEAEGLIFPAAPSVLSEPLQAGDRIIALAGQKVENSYGLLQLLQKQHVLVIVENIADANRQPISWQQADKEFEDLLDLQAIERIASSIGSQQPVYRQGSYRLLPAITPVPRLELLKGDKEYKKIQDLIDKKEKEIALMPDPEKRAAALKSLNEERNTLVLGIPIQDKKITYNPGPFEKFQEILKEMWRFLSALFTFNISLKWMAGPIGILQTAQASAWGSLNSALDWLAFVSINLGILNLLPIPVLDGGTIMLSLYEMATGHKIKPKTMEKLILPFALALICLFIFVTFNDINRIFNIFNLFSS